MGWVFTDLLHFVLSWRRLAGIANLLKRLERKSSQGLFPGVPSECKVQNHGRDRRTGTTVPVLHDFSSLLFTKKEHQSVIVSTSSMSTNFELRQTKFIRGGRKVGHGGRYVGPNNFLTSTHSPDFFGVLLSRKSDDSRASDHNAMVYVGFPHFPQSDFAQKHLEYSRVENI